MPCGDGKMDFLDRYFVACTKPYYFDVADDSRVCYVEKNFLSKVICKNLYVGVQCLFYDVSKRQFISLEDKKLISFQLSMTHAIKNNSQVDCF